MPKKSKKCETKLDDTFPPVVTEIPKYPGAHWIYFKDENSYRICEVRVIQAELYVVFPGKDAAAKAESFKGLGVGFIGPVSPMLEKVMGISANATYREIQQVVEPQEK